MSANTRIIPTATSQQRLPTCPAEAHSRRRVLKMALALGAVTVGAAVRPALGQDAAPPVSRGPMPTPDQILGPFYPVRKPIDGGADLTRLKGKAGPARGEVIYVAGRVLNMKGEPVDGAQLEVWQANSVGRYAHPSDWNSAPLDPNFEGYATVVSDAEGRYRFKTVKPGAYPVGGGWVRPPHIHFDVQRTGKPTDHADVLRRRAAERQGQVAARLVGQGQSHRQGLAAD